MLTCYIINWVCLEVEEAAEVKLPLSCSPLEPDRCRTTEHWIHSTSQYKLASTQWGLLK